MTAIQAIILGLIQGLTEFLPVSSSGHLLLGSFLLGLPAPGVSLSLLLHLGTALATVVMLWKEIAWLLSGLFVPKKPSERSRALVIIGLLIVASIPGGLVGVFFSDFIDIVFGSGGVAAVGLIITGFILRAAGKASVSSNNRSEQVLRRRRRIRTDAERQVGRATATSQSEKPMLSTLNLKNSLVVGVSQAVAIMPGISRSGTTIASGLLSGMEREDAARFSFLLSLPAVLGGALLDFLDAFATGESVVSATGLLGAGVSFLAGMFALSAVFRVVRKGEIARFAYYCWAAGGLSLVWLLVRAG